MDNYLQLLRHDIVPQSTVQSIEVMFERSESGALWVRYHAECALNDLDTDEPRDPNRTDGLWQRTCFEAFLMLGDGPEYIEFNFSPSSEWAAYQFTGYRENSQDLLLEAIPEIYLDASEGHFALEATVILPAAYQFAPVALGLSAITLETGGKQSFWALKHPLGKADFHHRDCFALQLHAPENL